MLPRRPLALLALLLLAACADPEGEPEATSPGVAPDVLDPDRTPIEERLRAARAALEADAAISGAQVRLEGETVTIRAVGRGLEGAEAQAEARRLAATARRLIEGDAPGPDLGPTRYGYHVRLRSDGDRLVAEGRKAPADSALAF